MFSTILGHSELYKNNQILTKNMECLGNGDQLNYSHTLYYGRACLEEVELQGIRLLRGFILTNCNDLDGRD